MLWRRNFVYVFRACVFELSLSESVLVKVRAPDRICVYVLIFFTDLLKFEMKIIIILGLATFYNVNVHVPRCDLQWSHGHKLVHVS